MKIKIKNDLFNICERIKEIDKHYFILFNLKTQKFEVHNSQLSNTYCLTLPYSNLDARALNYTHKTSTRNSDKIFAEIDYINNKIDKEKQDKILDECGYKFKDIYDYSSSNSKELNPNKIYQNKWI